MVVEELVVVVMVEAMEVVVVMEMVEVITWTWNTMLR